MSNLPLPRFSTLGEMLRYLRRRARLTQRELSIAVGYSESQISRLEQNERQVDAATLLAVFVPALEIEDRPEVIQYLLTFAAARTLMTENRMGAGDATHGAPTVHRPMATPSTNVPARLTSFIGREEAIEVLDQLIPATRLVTLTGVGGVGKTSLAQAVTSSLGLHFRDGVWWIELAPLAAANLVPQTINAVLKLPEPQDRTYLEALTTFCHDKHLLLILDNCEHVINACAETTEILLRACPQLHILATSREALRVAGEVEWPVLPLSTPKQGIGSDDLVVEHTLNWYEAVQLFVERAHAVQPKFMWTDQTAPLVALICTQLDGIPLAIELAASRLKGMTISELVARLNDRFKLLTGGTRTSLPRHQTLQAAVDWSYDLLSESEQAILRRLSVFSGGWTMDATEAIADVQVNGTQPIQNPLDVLLQLVNKSLVVAAMRDSQTRYHMLETIRQYAAEKLQEADEGDGIRARHFKFFLDMAKRLRDFTLFGRQLTKQMDQVEVELDNLRAALAWSREQADSGQQCLQLTSALWWFWSSNGRFHEGQAWLEEALGRGVTAPLPLRATAMYELAELLLNTSPERSVALVEEALEMCLQVGDRFGMAYCNSLLGDAAWDQSNYPRALAYYRQALHGFRDINLLQLTVVALRDMANVLVHMGVPDEAMPLYQECLAIAWDSKGNLQIDPGLAYLVVTGIFQIDPRRGKHLFAEELARQRTVQEPMALASVLFAYGLQLLSTGDSQNLDESIQLLTESLALWRELNVKWGRGGSIPRTCLHLGIAYTYKGEPALAMQYGREAIRCYHEVGDVHGVAWAQMSHGWPALAQGNLALAETSFRACLKLSPDGSMSSVPYALAGLAETLRQQGNLVRAGRLYGATKRFDNHKILPLGLIKNLPTMQAVHTYLDDPAFAAAWSEGKAMPLVEVIAYALA